MPAETLAPPAAAPPRTAPADDERILAELVELAGEDPRRQLLQFLSLAGAHR
jgi:hypothetical protein